MKNIASFLLILLVILLVACQEEVAEAPEPTVAPTEEPVAETEEVDLTALKVTPWQWISFTNPLEQFEVEMSENYRYNLDWLEDMETRCYSDNKANAEKYGFEYMSSETISEKLQQMDLVIPF